MNHPITPVRSYLAVFGALVVLTILTTVAGEIDLGPWNIVLAIAIAGSKASLVVWYFMHLKQAPPLTRLTAGAGLFWLAILILLTLADYDSRSWLPRGEWWSSSAEDRPSSPQ